MAQKVKILREKFKIRPTDQLGLTTPNQIKKKVSLVE
jgi:hypothetical protein